MANRPTAHFGTGGSDGAARSPAAYIVPARRVRTLPAANDNKPPLSRRLRRIVVYTLILATLAGLLLI
ncbi:hypothetical protein [Azospirillum sp. sgz302134]